MTTRSKLEPKPQYQRIIGLDFSGGVNAGHKIWIAEGHDEQGSLKIDALRPGHALPDSGVERAKVLPALCRYLQQQQNAVAGCDFPFALHTEQMPECWDSFAAATTQFATAEEFRAHYCDLVGGKELRRQTDNDTKTPLAPTNLRIYRQTFYGLRDLLLPLVKSGARVLPMHEPAEAGLHLIEVCPASLLKREKLYLSYKGRNVRQQEARTAIYAMLQERYGLQASAEIRDLAIGDAEGDALDSILAAIITWRAAQTPTQFHPRPASADALEGRVYD